MMKFASVLQEAVYQALLPITGTRIYDYVPETASLPYIRIGDDSLSIMDCKTDTLMEGVTDIEIFSEAKGYSELKALVETVEEKLESVDFYKNDVSVRFLGLEGVSFTRTDEFRQATVTARFIVA